MGVEEFGTVFGDCIDERRKKIREKKEEEMLRRELERFYRHEEEVYEEPQKDV